MEKYLFETGQMLEGEEEWKGEGEGVGRGDESRLFRNPYLYVALRFYVTSGENEKNIKAEYCAFGS